jgi:hypothetical protein
MTSFAKLGLAGLMALALFACSKPVEIIVGQTSVGPVTIKTEFDAAVVEKLFPSLDVEATVSSALQPGEHVIRVSNGRTALFEIYPALGGKTVESVLVLDESIKDDKGVHIGSPFAEAIPEANLGDCMAGAGEKTGRLYCPQPGSTHVIYELQGATPAPDGEVPPASELKDWHVTSMLWDGREPAH